MGKGNDSPAPPPATTGSNDMMLGMMDMYMGQMNSMMEGMTQMMAQSSQATPEMPPIPSVSSVKPIDWTEKQAQLGQKMKADYHLDQTRRKSREDTILTSPLLDEDDVETTSSVLAGN